MVAILSPQVIYMKGSGRAIGKATKEFLKEFRIEGTDSLTGKLHLPKTTRPPGKIDDYPRQGFIQGDIGMSIAGNTDLIPQGLGDSLSEHDADILYRMMGIHMEIAHRPQIHIDEPMARYLFQHVRKEGNLQGKPRFTRAIEAKGNLDPRLVCFPLYGGCAFWRIQFSIRYY